MKYIINQYTIMFSPEYNELLDINLISKCAELIFSDYILCDELFVKYENNDFKNSKCRF